jgi:hypothetical protein
MTKHFLLSIFLLFAYFNAFSQEGAKSETETKPAPEARVFASDQQVTINGNTIELTANAGTMG